MSDTDTPAVPARVLRRRGSTTEEILGPVPPLPAERAPTAAGSAPSARKSAYQRLQPFHDQMGVVDDGTVADLAGVSRTAVSAYRRRHDIPAYAGYRWSSDNLPTGGGRKSGRRPGAPPPVKRVKGALRPSRLDRWASVIGVEPDAHVAWREGVTVEAVRTWRLKRGVPPAPKAARGQHDRAVVEAVAPRGGAWVWRLLVKIGDAEQVRYAAADDAGAAAAQGQRLGEVTSVERAGESL